jgi:hypothetical protein
MEQRCIAKVVTLKGGWSNVSESAHGSKGTCDVARGIYPFEGDPIRCTGAAGGHYQEQKDLVEALHKGEYYNEADYGAMSTFTCGSWQRSLLLWKGNHCGRTYEKRPGLCTRY